MTGTSTVSAASHVWDQRRAELRRARWQRAELDREAASVDVVLRALLAVRRAREAQLSPELDRLQRQVEKLLSRARTALYRTDAIRSALEHLRGHGHGDLVDATPALVDALDREYTARNRLGGLLSEHLPQAAPLDQEEVNGNVADDETCAGGP